MKYNECSHKKKGWEGRIAAIEKSMDFYNTLDIIEKTNQQDYLKSLLNKKNCDKA